MRKIIAVDPQKCNGCRICEAICALRRQGECNPERSRIRVIRQEIDGAITALPLLCRQCEAPECLEACPAGALSQNPQGGTLRVDEGKCLACGLCRLACPIGAIGLDQGRGTAFACDLCEGAPQCVELCHSGCLRHVPYDAGDAQQRRSSLEEVLQAEGLTPSPALAPRPTDAPREPLRGGSILGIDLTEGKIRRVPTSRYLEPKGSSDEPPAKPTDRDPDAAGESGQAPDPRTTAHDSRTASIGGRGINLRLLYREVEPGADPLGPENALILGVGPLAGTAFPGGSRTDVVSKSPLTGLIGESSLGGYWGTELKLAGCDHLVIRGRASRPVYLFVHDREVEIREAGTLWGKDCYETQARLREELHDPRVQVLCIGPAGERLVRFASLHTGFGNTGGRTGLGAVMGSKNLKAIAVRGTQGVPVADPAGFFQECAEAHRQVRQNHRYEELHTLGVTRDQDALVRYRPGEAEEEPWEEIAQVSEEAFLQEHLYRKESCAGCPVACMESYRIAGVGNGVISCGPYIDFTCGPGNADMRLFWEAYLYCQKNGLDSRTCGGLLSSLVRLYQDEVISQKEVDGLRLVRGSREAILGVLDKIVRREGIGEILAKGVAATLRHFGQGTEDYFIHTKGSLHQAGISPMVKGFALSSSVSPTGDGIKGSSGIEWGAIFLSATGVEEAEAAQIRQELETAAEALTGTRQAADPTASEGKAALVYHAENESATADLTGVCTWLTSFLSMPIDPATLARAISVGTDRPIDAAGLLAEAERVHQLERAFNTREGLTRRDDTLPGIFLGKGGPRGKARKALLTKEELEQMKDEYYARRGWDLEAGIPTRATLERLGLREVADDLEQRGKLGTARISIESLPIDKVPEPPPPTPLRSGEEK
ncbi:MAG: 4Fe-4S binding protein [Candidatus Tectomicrobia bacterium]|uniref:4Fe-4S binding protein n=1 Tax=Tectimicrobiota bacterium TaxID=2528274 RepID=A0A932CS12_UNCTE|nr:4Fe-4S binding protein [Candidatus Tectomicrobia bacterium]